MWEARYGLPVLQRQENCFWGYLPGSVITLTPIGAPIRSDRRIGTILHDPSLDVMNQSPAVGSKVARQPRDFSSIPEPSTPQGHTTRRALEIAHAVNDRGAISRLTAESNRLRPVERERACEALLLDAPCFHNNARFLLHFLTAANTRFKVISHVDKPVRVRCDFSNSAPTKGSLRR
jgi:hypothetical protein